MVTKFKGSILSNSHIIALAKWLNETTIYSDIIIVFLLANHPSKNLNCAKDMYQSGLSKRLMSDHVCPLYFLNYLLSFVGIRGKSWILSCKRPANILIYSWLFIPTCYEFSVIYRTHLLSQTYFW